MSRHSRRSMLATLVGGSCALHELVSGAEELSPRPIGLGFSLYGMAKLPLAEAIDQCAQIGYDSVELALMPGYAAEPRLLRKHQRHALVGQLIKRRLVVAALMDNLPILADPAGHALNLDRLRAAGELAHDLHGVCQTLLETVLGGRPGQWPEIRNLVCDRLGQWLDVARQMGLTLAIKPHAGNALNRPEDARWLIEQLAPAPLSIVFDYSHYEGRGLSLRDALQATGSFAMVHVKDRRPNVERLEFLLPGQGPTNYTEYFRLLGAQMHYAGHAVVEVSGQIHQRPDYDPLAAARSCYDHLSTALAAAGVHRPARGTT